jgi:hypothetical protein
VVGPIASLASNSHDEQISSETPILDVTTYEFMTIDLQSTDCQSYVISELYIVSILCTVFSSDASTGSCQFLKRLDAFRLRTDQ